MSLSFHIQASLEDKWKDRTWPGFNAVRSITLIFKQDLKVISPIIIVLFSSFSADFSLEPSKKTGSIPNGVEGKTEGGTSWISASACLF